MLCFSGLIISHFGTRTLKSLRKKSWVVLSIAEASLMFCGRPWRSTVTLNNRESTLSPHSVSKTLSGWYFPWKRTATAIKRLTHEACYIQPSFPDSKSGYRVSERKMIEIDMIGRSEKWHWQNLNLILPYRDNISHDTHTVDESYKDNLERSMGPYLLQADENCFYIVVHVTGKTDWNTRRISLMVKLMRVMDVAYLLI